MKAFANLIHHFAFLSDQWGRSGALSSASLRLSHAGSEAASCLSHFDRTIHFLASNRGLLVMKIAAPSNIAVRPADDQPASPGTTSKTTAGASSLDAGPLSGLKRKLSVSETGASKRRAPLPVIAGSAHEPQANSLEEAATPHAEGADFPNFGGFGAPTRTIRIRESRSSPTGYRLDSNNQPCDRNGRPVRSERSSRSSALAPLSSQSAGVRRSRPQPTPTAYPSHFSQPAAPTPYNDCGLHTVANLTGLSQSDVVRVLGLSTSDVQHVAAHGLTPGELEEALRRVNSGSVQHRHGTVDNFVGSLQHLPDGHQFALGTSGNSSMGHVTAARRQGNSLEVRDSAYSQPLVFNSEAELRTYLGHSNPSTVHTYYAPDPTPPRTAYQSDPMDVDDRGPIYRTVEPRR